MRAIYADPPGGVEALQVRSGPKEEPEAGAVRIAVTAAGINRPDIFQREGLYPPPPGAPAALGLEVSGVIDALGAGVEGWAVGDAVCALVNGGGYADYATAPAGQVLPAPARVSLRDAAALPEALFTVWSSVFDRAGLRPGETVLVQGGASGIGVMAIQMAVAWGARVIATAGTDEKCALCDRLGAARTVNYRTQSFADVVKAEGGADVILDMVGGAYVDQHIRALRLDGRLVQIAFLQGSQVSVDLMRLMLKRLTVTGATLRARSTEEKARIAEALRAQVWPWIEAGQVVPVIDSVFALEEVAHAHARMESGAHAGKILLTP